MMTNPMVSIRGVDLTFTVTGMSAAEVVAKAEEILQRLEDATQDGAADA